VAFLQILQPKD